MKTISDYTIRCTEEQTNKALELGAPIELPTAEQMIGWMEGQGILFDIDTEWNKSVLVYVWDCENKSLINHVFHGSRKETILAAIDAALGYLSNKKK